MEYIFELVVSTHFKQKYQFISNLYLGENQENMFKTSTQLQKHQQIKLNIKWDV